MDKHEYTTNKKEHYDNIYSEVGHLYNDGMKPDDIAKKLDIGSSSVWTGIRRHSTFEFRGEIYKEYQGSISKFPPIPDHEPYYIK